MPYHIALITCNYAGYEHDSNKTKYTWYTKYNAINQLLKQEGFLHVRIMWE